MTRIPIRGDAWVGKLWKSCHHKRERTLLKLTQARSNRVNVNRGRINFKTKELNLTFSCFKSREKDKKMTLVSFEYLVSPKWQMLRWTFSFRESEKGQKWLLWRTRQKVYQTIRKTAYTPWQSDENQGLPVRQSIFPNAVFSALRLVRRQTRLPVDKGW